MTDKPRRLGRGLEALIGTVQTASAPAPTASETIEESPLRDIPLAAIAPNPYQPRRSFRPEELTELENSMRASGLLQPVTVRPHGTDRFELVAGERRLRAAARLGWASIPAVVKPLGDRDMLVLALVENLQRADLNPIDEALGLQRLIDEFGYSQQQVGDAVGKDRSTVANLLRVLSLPEGIRRLVRDDQISLGHARALLGMPNERSMLETARLVVDKQLSVREVERLTQQQRPASSRSGRPGSAAAPGAAGDRNPHAAEVRRLTEHLRRRLQTDVRIDLQSDGRGRLNMSFFSLDDLHRLVELLIGPQPDDA